MPMRPKPKGMSEMMGTIQCTLLYAVQPYLAGVSILLACC